MTTRCAIINLDDNTVENVVEYDVVPAGVPPGFDGNRIAVADDFCSPGWHWDGAKTFDPNPPVAVAPGIPQSVTPRQARLALLGAGLLDQVTTSVNSAGGATLITWEYASVFLRTDPLITQIGASLNLTDAQIDALFVQAATL